MKRWRRREERKSVFDAATVAALEKCIADYTALGRRMPPEQTTSFLALSEMERSHLRTVCEAFLYEQCGPTDQDDICYRIIEACR